MSSESVRSPLDLVLHVGSGETGGPDVQRFLDANRDRLAGSGCLYPRSPGAPGHSRLSLFAQPDDVLRRRLAGRPDEASSPAEFRQSLQRELSREVDGSGLRRVVLSDEALWGASEEALRRVRELTGAIPGRLRLVVYLRRQDDHLISRYRHAVMTGETRRLADRTAALDLSGTYDYERRLGAWKRVLSPDEFVVRRFEHDSLLRGSVCDDFLDAAGIAPAPEGLLDVGHEPEQLGAEAVELLRILNLCRAENEGARTALPANRRVAARVGALGTGPTLTLPAAELDRFMARWEQGNRLVARHYLGDDTEELFRAPRLSDNTTTAQYLDPTRLDDVVDVLEIPPHLRPSLRAIAEREARNWVAGESGTQSVPAGRRSARRPGSNVPEYYDAAARAVIERVRPRTMTQPEKLFGLILATRYVVANRIPGDIVECGVWRGGSMQAAALTLIECGDVSRALHLYDTFEGMTEPEEVDRRLDGTSAAQLLASSASDSRVWAVATLDEVRAGMAEVGYPQDRIHFHRGPVEETIPDAAPETVAILRLDTDWYASTRHELEHLYHRLSPGGVLIIDDYGHWEGSRRATDEFLEGTGAKLLLSPIADGRIAVKPGLPEGP